MKTRLIILFFAMSALGATIVSATQYTIGRAEQTSQKDSVKAPKEKVYDMFDVNPSAAGGDAGYNKFLRENIKYPAAAVDKKAQGTVIISILIEKDGTLSNVRIYKDPAGFGCGEEAARVIKLMPPWTPGKIKGQYVRSRYKIPVKFVLR